MSSLPSNFWEEFERRLDAKFEPVNRHINKIDVRLDKIDVRLDKIDVRLNNIDIRLGHMDGWMKRQDKSIEDELTSALQKYLQEQHVGYYTVKPTVFPKEITSSDGATITEFDGIMILTNCWEHANSLSKRNPKANEISPYTEAFIIIVEAKQHVTTEKIKKKILQKEKIERLILDIKQKRIPLPPRLSKVGIQYVKGVRLFIGGIEIDKSGLELFENYCLHDPMSGLIVLTGNRFGVNNISNDFGKVQYGGRNTSKL